jgi:hypothetical protein
MAHVDPDDPRAKLRKLRDRLAVEAPRARAALSTPPEIAERLQSALDLVSSVYLLSTGATAATSAQLDEVYEDALVEAHLVLHDWERWLEQQRQKPASRTPPASPTRRQHERYDTNVSVRLLRHSVHADGTGGATLNSEATSRPARNVSLGGIFVAVPKDELAEVAVGNVLHVSVSTPAGALLSFNARATVMRRDASGLALRWIVDSERLRKAIESLLDALRPSRPQR